MISITQRHSKQLITIFILIISILILAAIITKNQLKDTLINNHLEKLTALKYSLKVNINRYFDDKSNIIKTISYDKKVRNALINFSKEFKELEYNNNSTIDDKQALTFISNHLDKTVYGIPNSSKKKSLSKYIASSKSGRVLQETYIFNNKYQVNEKYKLMKSNQNNSYDKIHQKYHATFIDILKRHEFYDIFLIDKTGNIVYSVFKELDLGTNLKSGIYKTSSLASAYNKSMKNNRLSFSDFKPYEPSYNEAEAFFSIPLKEDNKNIGAIAFQISIDEINNIMTFNRNWSKIGLGKTGESYLIGQDNLMRTDSRFLNNLENDIVNRLNRTVGLLRINSKPIENALNRKDSTGIYKDHLDNKVLSSFSFVEVFDNVWGLIVQININEIHNEIKEYIDTILLTGLAIVLSSIFMVMYLLKRFIIEPADNYEMILEQKVKKRTEKLDYLNKNLQKKVNTQISKIRQKDKALLQQARIVALGEMLGNIAHQWRQPLSLISTSSSSLSSLSELGIEITQEQVKSSADIITKQTKYLSKTIDDLRDFINEDISKKESINLKDTIEKCIKSIENPNDKIEYILSLKDEFIDINENHIMQVLLNIVKNAIDSLKDSDNKYIFISINSSAKYIEISIKDSGLGISDDMMQKIFDPYTTTKHQAIGTGLGLYMSYQIINTIYKGDIKTKNIEFEYNNKKMKGAEFVIEIPK